MDLSVSSHGDTFSLDCNPVPSSPRLKMQKMIVGTTVAATPAFILFYIVAPQFSTFCLGLSLVGVAAYWIKRKISLVDKRDLSGWTPIYRAARTEHLSRLALLIILGANPNHYVKVKDEVETPLHFAALSANPELTKLLLSLGAERSLKNQRNQTPKDLLTLFQFFSDPVCEERRRTASLKELVTALKGVEGILISEASFKKLETILNKAALFIDAGKKDLVADAQKEHEEAEKRHAYNYFLNWKKALDRAILERRPGFVAEIRQCLQAYDSRA